MIANNSQRIGIIDLGSNTARLVILRTVPGYAYRLEDEIREVVRLREGMTEAGLSETAVARALFTLRLFKRFCDNYPVDHIIPTATSAVRDAANGPAFLQKVSTEIGLDLQVLDGEREAYYGTLGVLNEVQLDNGYVLDIGGGSAQVSKVRGNRYQKGASVPLGALALTEQFVRSDPIEPADVAAIKQHIVSHLDTIGWLKKKQPQAHRRLVGLGGTVRNLAKIEAVRQNHPLNTLHGFVLSRASIQETMQLLERLLVSERRQISGLSRDRADIIFAGALVVAEVMDRLQIGSITISKNGLREGLFLELFWHHLDYPVVANVRRFSVLNMARVYNYQKAHARHVRYLATRLFNQLAPLHGYGSPERELLDAAAMLHDLGTIISYDDHHKHSQTLIVNSGLPGFSPRETALIALLTRYHRKGKPSPNEFASLLSVDDQTILLRLAAILRLAEFLERGRNANVDDVTAVWDDNTLRLTLIADEYPAVELWEAERNAASLMELAFERQFFVESTAVPDIQFGI
ncbi:HD domain-containing protein [Candidatus Leptofilum sp.]|uniref:Ppx/GppA phosphatase family protein n=1 Tax=Candidatus Leptofilum sp. TaxID=3241576 RepID=UPI003B59D88F